MTKEKLEELKQTAFHAHHGHCDPLTTANQIAHVLTGNPKAMKAADRQHLEDAATMSLLRKATSQDVAAMLVDLIHRHEPEFEIPDDTVTV